MEDIAGSIKEFIRRELQFDESTEERLSNETPLLEGGVIDSLGLMQLVGFLENEFDIEIDDADIRVDHFRSVGDIVRMVERISGQERSTMPSAPSA